MSKQAPKHAKPTVFAGDARRGTVLLSDAGAPMLVTNLDFYGDHERVILRTRFMGEAEATLHKVNLDAELKLASISTAEFLMWEFSQYATLEGMRHDTRYRGQLAE